jgi:hypothetical protein
VLVVLFHRKDVMRKILILARDRPTELLIVSSYLPASPPPPPLVHEFRVTHAP